MLSAIREEEINEKRIERRIKKKEKEGSEGEKNIPPQYMPLLHIDYF